MPYSYMHHSKASKNEVAKENYFVLCIQPTFSSLLKSSLQKCRRLQGRSLKKTKFGIGEICKKKSNFFLSFIYYIDQGSRTDVSRETMMRFQNINNFFPHSMHKLCIFATENINIFSTVYYQKVPYISAII